MKCLIIAAEGPMTLPEYSIGIFIAIVVILGFILLRKENTNNYYDPYMTCWGKARRIKRAEKRLEKIKKKSIRRKM